MTVSASPSAAERETAQLIPFAGVCVLAVILFAIQVRHYWPFMADDAFISLRYSQRLLEGKGLTWSNGQRVEGYSNLLWVLLCAALGGLGMDLVVAARLLGFVSTLAALAALAVYVRESVPPAHRVVAAACALLSFALCAPIAVWTIGGLEQSLLLGLLGWTLLVLARYFRDGRPARLVTASLLLGAVTLTRADGFVFALLALGAVCVAGRFRRSAVRAGAVAVAGSVAAYLAQLAFRRWYYAEWVPNTALVKVSFTVHRLDSGLHYVLHCLWPEGTLLLLGVLGCVALWSTAQGRSPAIFFVVLATGQAMYVLLIGGDIFPAARHLVAVLMICCFAATHASSFAYSAEGKIREARAAALMVLAVLTVGSRRQGRLAISERWEWNYKELGLYLRANMPPNAVVVSSAAGAIPFFSQLDAIDPLGLCDRHIAHMHAAMKGQWFIGHELGDGKYVMDQRPDVIFLGPGGAKDTWIPGDVEIAQDPRLARDYEERRVHFSKPIAWDSVLYLRKPGR